MMKPAVVMRIRKELGLSGPALSKLLGGASNMVWKWEHGGGMSTRSALLLEMILEKHRAKHPLGKGKRGAHARNGGEEETA